jgi:alpha-L-arabinofuranosidase
MTQTEAELIVFANKTLGRVHDRHFGQFLELAGRCVNQVIDEAMDIPLGTHSRAHRELGGLPPMLTRRPVVETVADAPVFKAKHERFFCGIVDPEKAKDENLPTLEHFDDIPAVDALASVSEDGRMLRLSLVQKLPDRPLDIRLDLHGIAPAGRTMTVRRLARDGDLWVENTLDHPDRVQIESTTEPLADRFTLAPASLTVLEIPLGGGAAEAAKCG